MVSTRSGGCRQRGGYPAIGVLDGYAPASLPGQGTPEEPYRIYDANELGALRYYDPDAHYRLEADIELAGITWSTNVVIPELSGVFDGNEYIISDLTIDISDSNHVGLFGRLKADSEVRDLGIANASVGGTSSRMGILVGSNEGTVTNCHTSGTATGLDYVGGLVGGNRGTVADSSSTGEVVGENNVGGLMGHNEAQAFRCSVSTDVDGIDYVGGLAGLSSGDIEDCDSTSEVDGEDDVGGLVGRNDDLGIILACENTGSTRGEARVGGLVGDNDGGVRQCCNSGKVSGTRNAGGLAGTNSHGAISNSYNHGLVDGVVNVGGIAGYNYAGSLFRCYSTGRVRGTEDIGGIVGENTWCNRNWFPLPKCYHGSVAGCLWDVGASECSRSDGGMGKRTDDMKRVSTYLAYGWDFSNVWQTARNSYPKLIWQVERAPRISIEDANDLIGLAENPDLWDKHFVLQADIDLAGRSISPIPNFKGTFDGNGHTIFNLDMDLPELDSVGLFHTIDGPGIVMNVRLESVYVRGNNKVGALAGFSIGTIGNCYVDGVVSGRDDTGGLVGRNDGSISLCQTVVDVEGRRYVGGLTGRSSGKGRITSCGSAGVVGHTADGDYVGGLVGESSGRLTACANSAEVSGDDYIGGLAGRNTGSIYNCYSTGKVTGDYRIGGLVGRNTYIVKFCYAAGSVEGNSESNTGGLVGSSEGGSANNCLWDLNATGQTRSDGGKGRTTSVCRSKRR